VIFAASSTKRAANTFSAGGKLDCSDVNMVCGSVGIENKTKGGVVALDSEGDIGLFGEGGDSETSGSFDRPIQGIQCLYILRIQYKVKYILVG
jgi:hypothetical protein